MGIFRRKDADQPRRRQVDRSAPPEESPDLSRRFQRNRVLTHSSPEVEAPSERSKAHQLALRRRRVSAIFALVILVCVGLLLLLSQFTAQVTIGVGSAITKPLDSAAYAKTINEYLDHHPVERLRFALSSKGLNDFVTEADPEVASVTQNNGWSLGSTKFTITLRQPVAGWQINTKQFYVDQQGTAFQTNYFADPSVQIIDQSGASLQQGSTVTSARFLSFVGKLVAQAKSRGYTITQAKLPSGTTREVVVNVQDIKYEFRASIDRGAGEQAEDLDRVVKYLASHNITPGYVDLRVAGRAFYQ
jgi:cytoskeletal protein RodZ